MWIVSTKFYVTMKSLLATNSGLFFALDDCWTYQTVVHPSTDTATKNCSCNFNWHSYQKLFYLKLSVAQVTAQIKLSMDNWFSTRNSKIVKLSKLTAMNV